MHLETDPKTHGHFEQTRVGKTTVNSRLFVPNVLDYEQKSKSDNERYNKAQAFKQWSARNSI